MASLGAYLRELRERQGMSIDELSRATRVLHHYLEALESDDYRSLPAPVFARGFIKAYCQAVGVPPDEAIGLYEQHILPRRRETPSLVAPPPPDQQVRAAAAEQRQGRSRSAVLVSFVSLVVLGAALYAVHLGLQTGPDADSRPPVEIAAAPRPARHTATAEALVTTPAPAAPAPATAQPASAAQPAPVMPAPPVAPAQRQPSVQPGATIPSASPPGVAATGGAISPTAVSSGSPYRLVARTTETTWISVRTQDGRMISEETIPAGQVREWVSNRPFVVSIGNAGGVALELNGQVFPQLGPSGAVIRRLTLPSENP
jgi:cytoskeleton protein RodZ